jgi:hypothetical protein
MCFGFLNDCSSSVAVLRIRAAIPANPALIAISKQLQPHERRCCARWDSARRLALSHTQLEIAISSQEKSMHESRGFEVQRNFLVTFKKRFLVCQAVFLALLCMTAPALAQNSPLDKFTVNTGVGATVPVGGLSQRLDNGWNVNFGGGYNFVPHFGVIAEYMYNGLGVTRSTLNAASVPDGNARIHSVTLNPIVHINPKGPLDAYLIGGVGYYHRTVEFTEPSTATVLVFDPFFGFFVPAVIPVNRVIGRVVRDGFGGNLGGGFTYALGNSGVKLYTEARYHRANTGSVRTELVPVTVGLRW